MNSILLKTFPHLPRTSTLYPHQGPAIEAILEGNTCCTLAMPPNAGKAMIYELSSGTRPLTERGGKSPEMTNVHTFVFRSKRHVELIIVELR